MNFFNFYLDGKGFHLFLTSEGRITILWLSLLSLRILNALSHSLWACPAFTQRCRLNHIRIPLLIYLFCSSETAFIFVHYICPLAVWYRYTMQFVYTHLPPISFPPVLPIPGFLSHFVSFILCWCFVTSAYLSHHVFGTVWQSLVGLLLCVQLKTMMTIQKLSRKEY